jgi:hypothetical protein
MWMEIKNSLQSQIYPLLVFGMFLGHQYLANYKNPYCFLMKAKPTIHSWPFKKPSSDPRFPAS